MSGRNQRNTHFPFEGGGPTEQGQPLALPNGHIAKRLPGEEMKYEVMMLAHGGIPKGSFLTKDGSYGEILEHF